MTQVKVYFENLGKTKIDIEDIHGVLNLFLNLPDPLLGAEHVEGVVIKNYDFKTAKGKDKFFKVVRSEFKAQREDNWEDVSKIQTQMRALSNQLRFGKITEKQYQQGVKKLDYYTYLTRATAFDALFGIENRVAKAVAGIKEQNQEVNISNVIAWVREDLKEENYEAKIQQQYKKNEKMFDDIHKNKNPADIYTDFWRTAIILLKQGYNDVINKIQGA